MNRTREDVVRFIKEQLAPEYNCPLSKNEAHHYGKQELRVLLDYIYGDFPQTDEEKLK